MTSVSAGRATLIVGSVVAGFVATTCSSDDNDGSELAGRAEVAGTAGASLGSVVGAVAGGGIGGFAGSRSNEAGTAVLPSGVIPSSAGRGGIGVAGSGGTNIAGGGGLGTAGVRNGGGGVGTGGTPYCFEPIYFDGGVPLGADVFTWSNAPTGTFKGDWSDCGSPPEGLTCFKTTSTGWAGWGVFPKTQDSRNPWDLSACTRLVFWAKTEATTAITLKVEIQLTAAQSSKRTRYIPVAPGSWQLITVLKDDLGAADYSSVYGPFLVTVESGSQVFYVDDVRWTSGMMTGGAGGTGNASGGSSSGGKSSGGASNVSGGTSGAGTAGAQPGGAASGTAGTQPGAVAGAASTTTGGAANAGSSAGSNEQAGAAATAGADGAGSGA